MTRDTGVSDTADANEADAGLAPPRAGDVRFVAFNVHRLFDETCDSGACGPDDYEEVASAATVTARTRRIADALSSLSIDVACLEEVETAALLDRIADDMPGPRWSRVLGETSLPASVDVGLIARFPITSIKSHRDQVLTRPDGTTTTFTRDLLEVHLDVRGAEVVTFCAHFRSKANDDPGRRLAEAIGARALVQAVAEASPSALVLLGGDLNDVPGSPPLVALEEGGGLHRVSASLPDDVISTFDFAGSSLAIDHFYVATAALPRFTSGSFHAIRDLGARGYAGSDHALIAADFSGFSGP